MQVCTSTQITTPTSHHSVFLQAGCPFCRPTNSVSQSTEGRSTEGSDQLSVVQLKGIRVLYRSAVFSERYACNDNFTLERVQSTVMTVSLCLSAPTSQKPHGRTSPNLSCMLTVAVAQSSFGGVAIRYVRPVLWMTSCFHVMALWRIMFIHKQR